MPENLQRAREMISEGLQDEAREQLEEQDAVRTGFLRDNTRVTSEPGEFVVEFPDYGVFINEGTGTSFAKGPRPFYSNLILEGGEIGTAEEESTDIVMGAIDADVSEIEDEFNSAFE